MTFKSKKIFRKITLLFLGLLLSFIFFIESSLAEIDDEPYRLRLINALTKSLIKNNICKHDSCGNLTQMSSRGSKTIEINMYDQDYSDVNAHAVALFIEEALKISEGRRVILSAYLKPHDDYVNKGFKYLFGNNEHILRLDIKKEKNHAS